MKFYVSLHDEVFEVQAQPANGPQTVRINGVPVEIDIQPGNGGRMVILANHHSYEFEVRRFENDWRVHSPWGRYALAVETESERQIRQSMAGLGEQRRGHTIRAPMPGKIITLKVSEQQPIGKGEVVLVLEAMKMENEIRCESGGVVKKVHVAVGQAVEAGAALVEIQ